MVGEGVKSLQKGTMATDYRGLFTVMKARRTKLFTYGFMMAFVGCTAYLAFNPSGNGSPWFNSLFTTSSFSSSINPYRSSFNSFISHIFPNSTISSTENKPFDAREFGSQKGGAFPSVAPTNASSVNGVKVNGDVRQNLTEGMPGLKRDGRFEKESTSDGVWSLNRTAGGSSLEKDDVLAGKNQTGVQVSGNNLAGGGLGSEKGGATELNSTGKVAASKNNGVSANFPKESKSGSQGNAAQPKNSSSTLVGTQPTNLKTSSSPAKSKNQTIAVVGVQPNNHTPTLTGNPVSLKTKDAPASSNISASFRKGSASAAQTTKDSPKKTEEWIKGMVGCDIFHGKWVKEDSYPLYAEGSCPHIDEPFDCFHNGRPDRAYQKLRWQPDGCNVPRFNALDLLERLRGKRLVFVGDSLNRNMWESLVCVLKNSVKDKKKVFEASGRHEFRTVGSYSFLFKDYNCTVEFFRSPFLVQEWEMPDSHGKKKETLRLDIIERSSSRYMDANIIVFNTGHWWTHEKTAKGRDYYQEGNRVYSELNVVEAFHKALHTWAKWVDANINPKKTLIFFRGYSASHFRGGQWNSGGACDTETEPIINEKFLSPYPPKMRVLETVLNDMKTPVSYLNITRMTDFRKDAHPSIYRKQNLTEEERRAPERFQDCSHWCLPGVPDSWNELLYAQILIKQHQTPNW
ncbi:protein trichome birefringence-like [Phalaenopsis equestris]|uniref:protein trichome birefringence-like n=1 Tax=Phalaenopsis equestris TaxID=78828 RepID=UPI0009E1EA94|nr:protein trichome birefringence-like [Phalaenopsis equestris]